MNNIKLKDVKKEFILIDITRLIWCILKSKSPTGVERVCLAYVERYQANALAIINYQGKFYVLNRNTSHYVFAYILNWDKTTTITKLMILCARIIYGVKRHPNIYNCKILNVGHSNIKGLEAFAKKYNLSTIFMIHDLIPLNYPEYHNGIVKRFKRKIDYILKNATFVIANSKATILDIQRYATKNNIKLPFLQVAKLGYSLNHNLDYLPTLPEDHINKPYFVILGTIEPRKNHLMLLNIWRKMVEIITDKDDIPNLIIIGRRGWRNENIIHMLEDCVTIKNNVFELNNCSDKEVLVYLKNAQALLFPTFAEGYGLPLIEALAIGTPAIVSDIPVFHEIANDVPEYIDPLDGVGWMNMILEYSREDSSMRNKQLERIKDYKAPTWEEHFKIVDEILDKQ